MLDNLLNLDSILITERKFMVQRYLLIFTLLFSSLFLFGEESEKLDLFSRNLIESKKFNKNDINLFVKGDQLKIKRAVEMHGGFYKYGAGKYHHVNVPLVNLDPFLEEPAVIAV